jgi:hypothetical protein
MIIFLWWKLQTHIACHTHVTHLSQTWHTHVQVSAWRTSASSGATRSCISSCPLPCNADLQECYKSATRASRECRENAKGQGGLQRAMRAPTSVRHCVLTCLKPANYCISTFLPLGLGPTIFFVKYFRARLFSLTRAPFPPAIGSQLRPPQYLGLCMPRSIRQACQVTRCVSTADYAVWMRHDFTEHANHT